MKTLLFAGVFAALTLIAAPAVAQEHDHHPAGAGHVDHHADFQSGRLHVRLDGPEGAPDIILIPGLSSSPHVFDEITEQLATRYRVHRIHVQGFAGAPAMDNAEGPVSAPVAEEIARYIAEKHLDHPAVIGHSMGGTIAMMLAARHPDAVSRVMVVDQVPFMGAMFTAPNATPEAIQAAGDGIYAGMTSATDEAYHAQSAAMVVSMIATESRREGPLADAAASDRAVSSAAFRELVVTDLRPEIGRITVPLTVLYAKFNDPRMTNEITDSIYQASYAARPGTTLKRIDDSHHFIMLDQPAQFAAEVNAFLE